MVWETWVQSQVASYHRLYKWYLISPCLTLSIIRYVSRVKWSNPWKGVAPSPTPRCRSYWKESLLVALNYGRQLIYYFKELIKNMTKTNYQKQPLNIPGFVSITCWILKVSIYCQLTFCNNAKKISRFYACVKSLINIKSFLFKAYKWISGEVMPHKHVPIVWFVIFLDKLVMFNPNVH